MRFLFITQYFYPEQFSNNAIACSLVERGHSVTVIPCVPNYPAGRFFDGYSNRWRRDEQWRGVEVRRARTIPRGGGKLQLIANYLFYPLSAFSRIARLKEKGWDASFTSMPSPLLQSFAAILAKRFYGVPAVYWVQDLWPETLRYMFRIESPLVLRLLDAICGWLYRQADIIMVQSAAMPPLVERHGIAPERIRVLPNTAAQFYRPEVPESHPKAAKLVPDAPFVLMFAGNVGESQGLDLLVEAADLLRERDDIAYSIVGNGRAMEALIADIESRGLSDRFRFAGRHPEADMPGFFAQADAMYMSLKDYPNFALTVPYKMQAYMACAKPIICSIRGEGARIVEEAGAGLACPPEDATKLAEVINRMANASKKELEAMGARGRRYFEVHYAEDVVFGLIENALIEVTENS